MANEHQSPSPNSDTQRLSTLSTRQDALHSEDPTLISSTTPVPSTLQEKHSCIGPEHVKLDLNDHLTPHNDSSNLFAFVPSQLSALMDPKNLPLLHAFGGLQGVAKGLHVDLQTGLVPNQKIQNHVTMNDLQPASTTSNSEPPEPRIRHRSMTVLSTATGATRTEPATAFPQRVAVFGDNVLPEVKAKSIFQLMWMAFQDKTLVCILLFLKSAFYSLTMYIDIAYHCSYCFIGCWSL